MIEVIIEGDRDDRRFEKFTADLFSTIEGIQYETTAPTGRVRRSAGLRRKRNERRQKFAAGLAKAAKAGGGKSESVALAVKVSSVPSLTVLSEIAASAGAEFISPTATANVRLAFSGGEPLSVARTVIE